MVISRLRISTFRNIKSAELDLGRINVLAGANGSGKTSILEAVHVLGSGRSFRSSRPEPVINHEAERFTVHGTLNDGSESTISIGVMRARTGEFEGRIQGRPVHNTAELARCLPVLIINSSTFELLEGGPSRRRQFLDWGVFHVEQGFHPAWLEAQRALSQRNALLRHARIAPAQIDAWDTLLADAASRLDRYRQHYFEAFYPRLLQTVAELDDLPPLELAYHRGWDRERDLHDLLIEHRQRDLERGYTGIGPHRADIRARSNGLGVVDVLSRGQQKLVVCAMKLTQARVFAERCGQQAVFLVDDLPAELDRRHRNQLCGLLAGMQCQILVSCVEKADLHGCWDTVLPEQLRVFHVEHGHPSPER